MAKRIFTVSDVPIFIIAEDEEEAMQVLDMALAEVEEHAHDALDEVEGEVTELQVSTDSKTN